MKKTNILRICLPACLLLGLFSLTAAASAEENGFWTSRPDENGNMVQIFTYTEPVEIEISEDAGLGRCQMDGSEVPTVTPEEPVAGVAQAKAHWAAAAEEPNVVPVAGVGEPAEIPEKGTDMTLIWMAAAGVLMLAGLGYGLYKAV